MRLSTKKGLQRWTRFVCLLLALQFFLSMAPVEDTAAEDDVYETVDACWSWQRLDLIQDTSEANLSRYKAVLIMYEDGGKQYVLGTGDKYSEEVNITGYHSLLGGYSTVYSAEHHCYATSKGPGHVYGYVIREYGNSVAFTTVVAEPFSKLKETLPDISYGVRSFDSVENVSNYSLTALKREDDGVFSLGLQFKGQDYPLGGSDLHGSALNVTGQKVIGNTAGTKSNSNSGSSVVTVGTVGNDHDKKGEGKEPCKTWTVDYHKAPSYSKVPGSTTTYSNALIWHDIGENANIDLFWGTNGNHVFAEGTDVEKYSSTFQNYASIRRFYVYVGRPYSFTSLNNYVVKSGSVLEINAGQQVFNMNTLVVETGAVLTVKGTLVNNGDIVNFGTIYVRDGGTISRSIGKNNDYSYICCYSSVGASYARPGSSMTEGRSTEGSLLIEKNGRVIVNGFLYMNGGCLLDCDGELYLSVPILCPSGEPSLHFRKNSLLVMGVDFELYPNAIPDNLALVADRETESSLYYFRHDEGKVTYQYKGVSMERFYVTHDDPKKVGDGEGFTNRLVFDYDFSAYIFASLFSKSTLVPQVREGRVMVLSGWQTIHDGGTYDERVYPTVS